jgi:hypothetical protein
MKMPSSDVKISKEQAMKIVETSSKADPYMVGRSDEHLESAELQYISLNWDEYLRNAGNFNHLYISPTQVGEDKPYWIMDYGQPNVINLGSGRYIVDADTGELMAAMEQFHGFSTIFTPYFGVSSISNGSDPRNPLVIKDPSDVAHVDIRIDAKSSYDASLPVSVTVVEVPVGYYVSQNVTSLVLRTGGSAAVRFNIGLAFYAMGPFIPLETTSSKGSYAVRVKFTLAGEDEYANIYVPGG